MCFSESPLIDGAKENNGAFPRRVGGVQDGEESRRRKEEGMEEMEKRRETHTQTLTER